MFPWLPQLVFLRRWLIWRKKSGFLQKQFLSLCPGLAHNPEIAKDLIILDLRLHILFLSAGAIGNSTTRLGDVFLRVVFKESKHHLGLAAAEVDAHSLRLVVTGRQSGVLALVDTGADMSLLPTQPSDLPKLLTATLYAANNSKLNTYVQLLLSMNFGLRRVIPQIFITAHVSRPIHGADFCRNPVFL